MTGFVLAICMTFEEWNSAGNMYDAKNGYSEKYPKFTLLAESPRLIGLSTGECATRGVNFASSNETLSGSTMYFAVVW